MPTEVEFPFNERKAKEATAEILRLAGGVLDRFHIVKCIYFADRISLARRERPICGGRYHSMEHGPVHKQVYARFTAKIPGWEDYFRAGLEHDIHLLVDFKPRALSKGDLLILSESYSKYGQMPMKQLWELVHSKIDVPEYEDPQGNAKGVRIPTSRILRMLGKSEAELSRIKRDVEEAAAFASALPSVAIE